MHIKATLILFKKNGQLVFCKNNYSCIKILPDYPYTFLSNTYTD